MKLKIAEDLSLPIAAVTEVIGFLGRRGQGKSYAAQKLAELLHAAGAPFIVLDPVGNWWGLRLAADGQSPGIAIPVLGGLHGDIPLEPTAGKLMADVVADRRISAVLDVSQFESDAEKARFAHDFGARFYYRQKQAPAAVHLFLEECQEFVPQNPQREETRLLHVFQRIVKLGRNYGIGVSLISQRPQEVHKKVLNLTELLFVFQLTGPHERKAVEHWIQEKGLDEDIAGDLPKLQRGAPHAWSPAWLQISKVVHIAEKWTFDASSTPTVGKAAAPRALAPIDLEKLAKDMAATIERARADDPREFRRQIAELKKQLALTTSATAEKGSDRVREKIVEKQVLTEADRALLGRIDDSLAILRRGDIPIDVAVIVADIQKGVNATVGAAQRKVLEAVDSQRFQEIVRKLTLERDEQINRKTHATQRQRVGQQDLASPPRRGAVPTATARRPAPRVSSASADGTLGRGEHTILRAIAQYPEGASREQLTVLTGYKRSSRDTYLQRLQAAGLVEQNGTGLRATGAGVAVLGCDHDPLPTGSALQEYWLNRLTGGERAILEVVLREGDLDRERVSELTGYKRSSRDTYIQRLMSRRLLTGERGIVRASDHLFD